MQNKNEWIRKLGEQVEILVAEPMKNHTTFRIGGPADALALPKTPEEVAEVVRFCHEHAQPYYVLGNGSNCLFRMKDIAALCCSSIGTSTTFR